MRVEIVTTVERLAALEPAWNELAKQADASILSSHRFLSSWWRAFGGVDELRVLAVFAPMAGSGPEALVAVWPLHLRAARTAALGARTLTPLGDLRAMERTVIASPTRAEPAVAAMLARLLELRDWDFLDAPREDGRIMDALARVAAQAGNDVQLDTVGERAIVELPVVGTPAWDELARSKRPLRGVAGAAYAPAELDVAHAIDELQRLLRREWAERDQASPALDPALASFLKDVLPEMTRTKRARIGLVALAGVGAIAADVVIVDGDRHAQVLRGTDPEHAPAGATEQLCWASLELAAKSGARRFELADEDSSLRTVRVPSERLQIWNGTAVGRVHRGVATLRGKRTAGARPRTAIGRVLDKIERLGNYKTLHLYRGELFTREVDHSSSLRLEIVDLAGYQAMSAEAQGALVARLELSAGYTLEKWRRGDLAVIASVDGRPAGIAWCARAPVFVPDIAHRVQPLRGECYIHDVFVHPDDRGRKIAPAMLEHLALYLRGRDVYRAWALIERTNTPSVRAFERAAYVAVADVIYVHMGIGSHLFVRPPDPEARAFLGV